VIVRRAGTHIALHSYRIESHPNRCQPLL
jgi:hypothetical protein